MKNVKTLLVITLAFALFMVCGTVKADQVGGAYLCNSEKCSIKIEKVNLGDALEIDPELLTLDEGEVAFAVSAASNESGLIYGSGDILFTVGASYVEGLPISDMILGYVPNSRAGIVPDMKYTSYNALSINQHSDFIIDNDFRVIGYLVVKEEYADEGFSAWFEKNYYNYGGTDVTLNGIMYDDDISGSSAVNTDILFGDFRFNYVLTVDRNNDANWPTTNGGYWNPVNGNSNKVIVDNTNSISTLYYDFYFSGNQNVKMGFYEQSVDAGVGDVGSKYLMPENYNNRSELFYIVPGKSQEIRTSLFGGSESVARDILKGDGIIGRLTLRIASTPDQLG